MKDYPFENIFQKFAFKILTIFKVFRQSYQRPGPFRAILSICFRGPWLRPGQGHNCFLGVRWHKRKKYSKSKPYYSKKALHCTVASKILAASSRKPATIADSEDDQCYQP